MIDKALNILKLINSKGYEAYIVGGFARDLYLNKQNNDIDICTSAKVEDLINIFGNESVIKKGFGSSILKYEGYDFQITTFRKEFGYIKNRYPKVEFIDSLEEDLKRRDFIMNTLCIDSNGKFIDLLGARNDIDNRIIKCVCNADKKIEEDALRIIRAIRFSSDLDFNIDESLDSAIKKYKDNLKNISKNRVNEEFMKVKNKEKFKELIKTYKL